MTAFAAAHRGREHLEMRALCLPRLAPVVVDEKNMDAFDGPFGERHLASAYILLRVARRSGRQVGLPARMLQRCARIRP